jgi:sodium pump decarboxylase gamma subunit
MLGEQLLMSLKVLVLGMGTVFIALIALIIVIELVNKVLNISNKLDERLDSGVIEDRYDEKMESHTETDKVNLNQDEDDEELIAVIAAAIAASLNRSTHDIIVKSVKRVPSRAPAWNRVGRNQQIAGRL